MRLLITGGTGFIGHRLALLAHECSHAVYASGLTNTPVETARQQTLAAEGIEVAILPLEAKIPPDLVAGHEAIVHLAAAQHEMNVPDEHFRKVNVVATQNLFEAARAAGVRRFVYGSTIGVYGMRAGVIDETTAPAPDNVYGATKLEAERWLFARTGGPEVVVIRIGETYGPGDRRLLKLFRGVAQGRLPLLGHGRNLHQPIYVDDLGRGLLAAADPDRPAVTGRELVLAGPRPVTTNEMVAAIAAALDRPLPRLRLPLAPFLGSAWLLETTLRPLGIQPPLHRRRMDFFTKSLSFAHHAAETGLGFVPAVTFEDGARRTAAWYREQGLL